MTTQWEKMYAHRTQRMGSSVIRELLKLTEKPDFISFAGGLPAPEVFPVKQVAEAVDTLMKEMPTQALQYSTTEGYRPLRELLARTMSRPGITVSPDNLLITSGSQQALDLLGKLFIDPGDRILVEAPTTWGRYRRGMPTRPSTLRCRRMRMAWWSMRWKKHCSRIPSSSTWCPAFTTPPA